MQVAVLIPAMRSHRIEPLVENIRDTTTDCHIIVAATGECADVSRKLGVTLLEDEGGTYATRINAMWRICQESYAFLGADDLRFTDGWFDAARMVMDNIQGGGVVAVCDLHNASGVHFLVGRDYITQLGGSADAPGEILHEGYVHTYCDDEIRNTAQSRGRFAYAPRSIVEHMHPGAGKSPTDEVYQMGESSMSQGLALFQSRKHLWETLPT